MDLTTTYLGLPLRSPIVVSASPISERIDNIQRAEAAGAAAVVIYSLFEEQLQQAPRVLHQITDDTYKASEVKRYFPKQTEYHLIADAYLEHIYAAKQAVSVPVIGSLNCTSSAICAC